MWRKLLGATGLLVVCIAGFWSVAGAQTFRSGGTSNVQADETISSTLWIAGRTITIAGTVDGDVFCAGQNVTISGTVRGDVLCAAQTITISGDVDGDIRTAAQTVTLDGAVARNASVAAQSFTQGIQSAVGGDISVGAAQAVLGGFVGRDAAIGANSAQLNGKIGRNAQANVTTLSLSSGAQITGNLTYTSSKEAKIAAGASVKGETTRSAPSKTGGKSTAGGKFGLMLYMLAAALVTGLALVLLFPQAIQDIAVQGLKSPGKALLVGLIAEIVVPFIVTLLMLTIVGIPLALLLLVTWILLHVLAAVAAAFWLGRILWRRQHNVVMVMLIGVIVLVLLRFIPIVGFIIWVLATLLGLGMILLSIKHHRPKPRYNPESHAAD